MLPARKMTITSPLKANPFEPAVASKMLAIPIYFGESGVLLRTSTTIRERMPVIATPMSFLTFGANSSFPFGLFP